MKPRFILGVDIDGVCGDFLGGCAFMAAREYGLNIWPHLRLPVTPPKTEKIISRYQHTRNIYVQMNPIPYAAAMLHRLLRSDMGLVYITARPMFAKQSTTTWLNQHGFPQSTVINVRNDCKIAAVKRERVDLFIEDRPCYANPLIEAGVPTILLDVYNRDLGDLRQGMWVARSWQQAAYIAAQYHIYSGTVCRKKRTGIKEMYGNDFLMD